MSRGLCWRVMGPILSLNQDSYMVRWLGAVNSVNKIDQNWTTMFSSEEAWRSLVLPNFKHLLINHTNCHIWVPFTAIPYLLWAMSKYHICLSKFLWFAPYFPYASPWQVKLWNLSSLTPDAPCYTCIF